MTTSRPFFFGLCLGGLVAGMIAAFASFHLRDDEARILSLLHAHGDVLLDAITEETGKRRQAQQLQRDAAARGHEPELLAAGPDDPVLGNPQGRRTIVYFFDATCHFCREIDPTLHRMLRADPELRLILRQVAILGPRLPDGQIRPDTPSWRAAVYGDAAWHLAPTKYPALIEAIMTRPIATADDLHHLVREHGLDPDRFESVTDAASHIARNSALFRLSGGQGTPHLLVKGEGPMEILSGAVPEAVIISAFSGSNPKH